MSSDFRALASLNAPHPQPQTIRRLKGNPVRNLLEVPASTSPKKKTLEDIINEAYEDPGLRKTPAGNTLESITNVDKNIPYEVKPRIVQLFFARPEQELYYFRRFISKVVSLAVAVPVAIFGVWLISCLAVTGATCSLVGWAVYGLIRLIWTCFTSITAAVLDFKSLLSVRRQVDLDRVAEQQALVAAQAWSRKTPAE